MISQLLQIGLALNVHLSTKQRVKSVECAVTLLRPDVIQWRSSLAKTNVSLISGLAKNMEIPFRTIKAFQLNFNVGSISKSLNPTLRLKEHSLVHVEQQLHS